jgi:ribosomal protein S18 acetylase RimI-like enzyme
MSLELYFLRSSEQKIVTDMLYYAQNLQQTKKQLSDFSHLEIYHTFYGLTPKDLGLYAMKNAQVCGAVWYRRLNATHNSNGFIDEQTPVMQIAVKPEFRGEGVATFMLEQFLQEVAATHKHVSVSVSDDERSIAFFTKFGFYVVEGQKRKSYTTNKDTLIMKKDLQLKEVCRPSDGYDPRKWMD